MALIPEDRVVDKMESMLNIASDFTRLKILYSILREEKNVSEIVSLVGASQSLVSHQLNVLRKAHLVVTRREGHKVFYSLADSHVESLLRIVEEHAREEK